MYKHQAKATKEFGITFRSQLEAKWAYYFHAGGYEWDYADHPWYDFTVFFDDMEVQVEIKPSGYEYWEQAIVRAFKHRAKWKNNKFVTILGEPGAMLAQMTIWTLERVKLDGIDQDVAFGELPGKIRECRSSFMVADTSRGVKVAACPWTEKALRLEQTLRLEEANS